MSKYKILTISGGGVRGILSAAILKKLEQTTGKRIQDQFDLIVGTSTGGIVAASLAHGYNPSQIVDLYYNNAKDIFNKGLGYKLKSMFGFIKSSYPSTGLKETIDKFLGSKKLNEAECDILVTAYNTFANDVVLFKSWKDDFKDFTLADIAIATSSAPTYFPSYQIDKYNFIDGGIYANNPVIIAWTEALKKGYKPEDISILSIGTGYKVYKCYDTRNWGLINWLKKGSDTPILDMVFDGVEEKDVYITKQIFSNFVVVNPILFEKNSKMSNSKDWNLKDLISESNSDYVENNLQQWIDLNV